MNWSGFLLTLCLVSSGIALGAFSIDRGGVKHIAVTGDLDERQLQELTALVAGLSPGSPASGAQVSPSNVAGLKARFDQLDWIHHTNVMKDWPDGLIVEVIPEQVIAYWNDDAFISEEGRVLVTELFIGSDLPYLYGPPGTEQQVMTRYQELSRALAGTGDALEMLRLTARGSWEFETDRLQVRLGREDVQQRMGRFLAVRQALATTGDLARADRMDARYTNGVAVHYRPEEQRQRAPARPAAMSIEAPAAARNTAPAAVRNKAPVAVNKRGRSYE